MGGGLMLVIQQHIGLRVGYLIVGAIVLWWMQVLHLRRGNSYSDGRWRFGFYFKAVNYIIFIGYIALVLSKPLWSLFTLDQPVWLALIVEDLLNLGLLLSYLTYFFWLSYQNDCNSRGLTGGFWSYLLQYGYFWLFIINCLLFLRLDYYYLDLIPIKFPGDQQLILELVVLSLMLLSQLAILAIRRVKMSKVDPQLIKLVNQVADRFGIKIRSVRLWHLERVSNAFATGLFRRSIFLTDTLLESANPEDLQMIIAHECAHFKRRHLEVRVLILGLFIYAGTMIYESFPDLAWPILGVIGLGALIGFKAIARAQEYDADRQAALVFGSPERMETALIRVFGYPQSSQFGKVLSWLIGHPEPAKRIKRLRCIAKSLTKELNI